VQLVRPGGCLVFSTCTISPMENEGNVRWLLDTYPRLALVQQEPRLGGPGLVGRWRAADEWGEARAPVGASGAAEDGDLWLDEAEAALVQRFDPRSDTDATIGFFIAKFVKLTAS
jgi:16S rRNA C967 or C1407 C5-methylase (RsmB/RsmF family)